MRGAQDQSVSSKAPWTFAMACGWVIGSILRRPRRRELARMWQADSEAPIHLGDHGRRVLSGQHKRWRRQAVQPVLKVHLVRDERRLGCMRNPDAVGDVGLSRR